MKELVYYPEMKNLCPMCVTCKNLKRVNVISRGIYFGWNMIFPIRKYECKFKDICMYERDK